MYTITVQKVTREQVKKKEHKQIGEDDEGEPKYGYVDNETTGDVTREVYTQIVEDLDLKKVINAVNEGVK